MTGCVEVIGNIRFATYDTQILPRPGRSCRARAMHWGRVVPVSSAGSSNLPHPMTPLIGRQRELNAIGAALANPRVRLVTLVGTGGVGKTRLAVEASWIAARDFTDGVCYVDLAPLTDPALVPAAVAQALRLPASGKITREEELIEFLGDRNLLLVFDNFEHVTEAGSLVPQLLERCQGLVVLVTSRTPLRSYGEKLIPVEPLELPQIVADRSVSAADIAGIEAVRLFVERAQAMRDDFVLTDDNAEDIAEICRLLDGLPLAIELAAARLKVLTPRTLRDRLTDPLPLLGGGPSNVPERQRTLRDSVAWSYRDLPPEEQDLFRCMAVFVGGCSLEALEAVQEGRRTPKTSAVVDAPSTTIDQLSSLIDKNLVHCIPSPNHLARYGMLMPIREFGLEQIEAEREETTTRWAHAGYFLRLVERAEPDIVGSRHAEWIPILDAETPNIRSAIQWCVSLGEEGSETALRLCKGIWFFWKWWGYLTDAMLWLNRSLEVAADANPLLLAQVLNLLGQAALSGNIDEARGHFERCLELSRLCASKELEAWALGGLGMVDDDASAYEDAEARHRECLRLYHELGDDDGIANSTHHLGAIAIKRGNLVQARKLLEEALRAWQELGQRTNEAYALIDLARIHRLDDVAAPAKVLLTSASALLQATGNKEGEPYVEVERGQVVLTEGNYQEALDHFGKALITFSSLGLRDYYVAAAVEGIARIALAFSQHADGVQLAAAANAWRQRSHIRLSVVDQRALDRQLKLADSRLGKSRYEAHRLAGTTMSLADAIAAALRIRIASNGGPRTNGKAYPQDLQSLSSRERDVLCLIVRGNTDSEIGADLGITEGTARTLVARMLLKLQTHYKNRTQAAVYAERHHFCDNEDEE